MTTLGRNENNIAHALRGAIAHHQAGRLAEAEAIYRQILLDAPGHPEALHLLGLIAYQIGKHEIAADLISQAIAAAPANPANYNLLGSIFSELGKQDEAVGCHRKAIALKPDFAEAHNNLGNVYKRLKLLDDAVASYKMAIACRPDYVNAYIGLGIALHEQGKESEAVTFYRKAILLRPDSKEAYFNLGNALYSQGNMNASVECYRKALSLNPDYAEAYNNLGNLFKDLGDTNEAVANFHKILSLRPDSAEPYNNYLMAIQYSPNYTQRAILNAHRAFAEQFEAPLRHLWPLHENSRDPERRLKVGFVSGDFRVHPVAFFIEALLTHLNRNTLEVVLYYNHTVMDEVTLRLKGLGHLWRSLVDVTDDQAAQLVRDDGIDILIDLSGHTSLNRLLLFARKPAPVQVAWLGYFDTTGLQAMDYILGDPHMLPPAEADRYVEKPWRLPETYLCFTPPRFDVQVEELPAIRNGFITFGSFNNLAKLNDEVVALWARILRAVPDSRLFFKTQQFNDPVVQQSTAQRFSLHGIDTGRLIFEGWSSNAEHFSAYNRMDVALDPFPFPGGTTSVNALWMGVPVLHLQGDRFISHAGESILINIGLPEWIAADADDYLRLATQLTGDLPRLAKIRAGLREKLLASPLCDAPRFARNFEIALRGMWEEWCSRAV